MKQVIRGKWADAICNGDFICINTWSGYSSGFVRDHRGAQIFLAFDVSDEVLGGAVLESLAQSRCVLGVPREGSIYLPDVEFDMELYDYKLSAKRYAQWVKDLMTRYDYKTKRALFKDMKNCSIESKEGVMTIAPSCHQKLEQWGRETQDEFEDVKIPSDSSVAEIGAALRVAFSRCT